MERKLGVLPNLLCSATATCTGEVASLSFDTAKVRLMLQKSNDGVLKYNGLLGTMATMAREEGPASLWKGLVPGLHRQIVFGGLRIGLYQPVKDLYEPMQLPPLVLKIAAGISTGVIGMTLGNPTELVKVRIQAQGQGNMPIKYLGALAAYRLIVKEEGLRGLWTAFPANLFRNSTISTAELVGYDLSKEALIRCGFEDGVKTHAMAAVSAGLLATSVGNPIDVVKTRLMADQTGEYTGILQCFTKTFQKEGPLAFYKGALPQFTRIGWFLVCVFVTFEQVKARVLQWQA